MNMFYHGRTFRVLSSASFIALSGCVKLARESPRLQFYALGGGPADTVPTTTRQPSAVRGAFTIGLRRIELAPHLAAPAVMIRRGANELVVSEFHRWGGDLDQSINRAVGAYLTAAPRVRAVDVAPWTAGARHDVIVQLRIARFEGEITDSVATAGRVHVMAGWEIIRPLDGSVMMRGSTDERSAAFRLGDYPSLVGGLDAALSRVARDIGACLEKFPNDSTPPANCSGITTEPRSRER